MTEPEIVEPRDRAAWRRWLRRHHTRPDGARILIRKKGSDVPGLAYDDSMPSRRGTRRQILYWVRVTERPETRARRIAETARLAERGIRVNQWRPGC
jgi:hypothetical protein